MNIRKKFITTRKNSYGNDYEELNMVNVVIAGIGCLLTLVVFMGSFFTIQSGQVGVVKRFGEVRKTVEPGFSFKMPIITRILKYNTKSLTYETTTSEKQQTSSADYKDFPVDTNTSDGQQVDIFYTIRFNIQGDKADDIAIRIGKEADLVEKIVKTESRVWVRNIPREYSANQLYTGNVQEVQTKIEERLRPVFEENGIYLDSFGIREIKFTEEYVQAVENKQIEAV